MRTAACLILAWAAAGCAAPRAVTSQAPPPDFALSLTINTPAGADATLSPAWFIVDCDGSLRAALGARTAQSPVPARVRRLSPTEMQHLWNLTRSAGVLVPPPRGEARPDGAAPAPGLLAYVTADGRRWGKAADPNDAAMRDLIETIRRLAWIEEGA
ncbi:MAG: hypothetical protein KF864_01785 [Phycisphaeraceae bacterium]|nr:hypothetical protein [Phycisphaeraceae bacterium]